MDSTAGTLVRAHKEISPLDKLIQEVETAENELSSSNSKDLSLIFATAVSGTTSLVSPVMRTLTYISPDALYITTVVSFVSFITFGMLWANTNPDSATEKLNNAVLRLIKFAVSETKPQNLERIYTVLKTHSMRIETLNLDWFSFQWVMNEESREEELNRLFNCLSCLKKLQSLSIMCFEGLKPHHFEKLKDLPIKELNISFTNADEVIIKQICQWPKLRSLIAKAIKTRLLNALDLKTSLTNIEVSSLSKFDSIPPNINCLTIDTHKQNSNDPKFNGEYLNDHINKSHVETLCFGDCKDLDLQQLILVIRNPKIKTIHFKVALEHMLIDGLDSTKKQILKSDKDLVRSLLTEYFRTPKEAEQGLIVGTWVRKKPVNDKKSV